MPAKWQKWMPLYIDRLLGSSDVQMMAPAAFKGYLCLLLAAWQTDDCTLPTNPVELAGKSRLGPRLWSKHCREILPKFVTVTVAVSGTVTERYRNEVEYELWCEAKRVHEARSQSGHRTNEKRSPSRSPQRSAGHSNNPLQEQRQEKGITPPTPSSPATLEKSELDGDFDDEPPEGLTLIHYRQHALRRLKIAETYGNQCAMGDGIKAIAQHENATEAQATLLIIQRYRANPHPKNVLRFWVDEGGWKQAQGISTEGWEP